MSKNRKFLAPEDYLYIVSSPESNTELAQRYNSTTTYMARVRRRHAATGQVQPKWRPTTLTPDQERMVAADSRSIKEIANEWSLGYYRVVALRRKYPDIATVGLNKLNDHNRSRSKDGQIYGALNVSHKQEVAIVAPKRSLGRPQGSKNSVTREWLQSEFDKLRKEIISANMGSVIQDYGHDSIVEGYNNGRRQAKDSHRKKGWFRKWFGAKNG